MIEITKSAIKRKQVLVDRKENRIRLREAHRLPKIKDESAQKGNKGRLGWKVSHLGN